MLLCKLLSVCSPLCGFYTYRLHRLATSTSIQRPVPHIRVAKATRGKVDIQKVSVEPLGLLRRGWESNFECPMKYTMSLMLGTAPNKSALLYSQNSRRCTRQTGG